MEKVKPWSQGWLIAAGAYPGFCSIKRLEVFLLPLDGMLVHRRSLPRNFVRFPQQIAGTHLYTWVERGTVRVKCLAQEHNTLSPARARTRTARSRVERTNHEATAPPSAVRKVMKIVVLVSEMVVGLELELQVVHKVQLVGWIRNSGRTIGLGQVAGNLLSNTGHNLGD